MFIVNVKTIQPLWEQLVVCKYIIKVYKKNCEKKTFKKQQKSKTCV